MIKKDSPLTAEQLAGILEISEKTVKKLARDGELPCVYENRRPLFYIEALCERFRAMEGRAA